MRKFGPTNRHGTAFAPKQWLYEKEATCLESSKLYSTNCIQNCIPQVGADTVLTSAWPQTPRVMRGSIVSRMKICGISGLTIPMVPRLYKCNGYIKRKLQTWRVQKCIALVSVDSVLTSAFRLNILCHGGVV